MTPQATVPIEIVGPYSAWPRKRLSTRGKVTTAAVVAGAATFAHCVAPML